MAQWGVSRYDMYVYTYIHVIMLMVYRVRTVLCCVHDLYVSMTALHNLYTCIRHDLEVMCSDMLLIEVSFELRKFQ